MKRIIIIALIMVCLLFIGGVVHGVGDINTDTSPPEAQEQPLSIKYYQNSEDPVVTMNGSQLQNATADIQHQDDKKALMLAYIKEHGSYVPFSTSYVQSLGIATQ